MQIEFEIDNNGMKLVIDGKDRSVVAIPKDESPSRYFNHLQASTITYILQQINVEMVSEAKKHKAKLQDDIRTEMHKISAELDKCKQQLFDMVAYTDPDFNTSIPPTIHQIQRLTKQREELRARLIK